MTLVLAGRVGDAAVLAADRLVCTHPNISPRVTGEGDKLFELGTCGVATFGTSAAGINVPEVMREYRKGHWELPDLAAALNSRRTADGCRELYGMFLMGRADSGVPELWVAGPSEEPTRETLREGVLRCAGQRGPEVLIDTPHDLEELASTMLAYFYDVSAENEYVGGPYDFLVFDGRQPPCRYQRR